MEKDRLESILKQALAAGADSADILLMHSISTEAGVRLGRTESLERSQSLEMGLRVFKGGRQAIVSSNDLSDTAVEQAVGRAVSMVAHIPEDEFCGIAEEGLYAQHWEERLDGLDTEDKKHADLAPDLLLERALQAEAAALDVKGIENSEGAEFGWSRSAYTYLTSTGFCGAYTRTGGSVFVAVLAGKGTEMERDYATQYACHWEDFEQPEETGRRAAQRTLKRLNPKKISTAAMPVVFDPRVSASLLRHLSGAISGASVARGTSFLKNEMGKKIFADGVTIIDDPLRRRGLSSQPFDDEGVACEKLALVKDGVLQHWLLDLRSARQLDLVTNGRAARGLSSPSSPSATNLSLQNGKDTPEALIGDIKNGLYVTELMGHGINMVTGDYSRGAFGFLIENGEITSPVSEITIAGNLKDMWLNLTPANDLRYRYGTDAPTLLINGMTVAGN